MNRSCLAAWPLLAALSLRAHAQTTAPLNAATPTATQVPQRISYRCDVPASVLKMMPRGAQSSFYGTFRFSPRGREHALHLFDLRPERGVNAYNSRGRHAFVLDVFERHGQNWRRVNRLSLNYRSSDSRLNRFSAELLWLDPLKRQQPVLHLRCYTTEGLYGDAGNDVLLVFAKGLAQSAVGQSFWFGGSNASYFLGQHSNFQHIGADGLMRVLVDVEVAIPSAVDESLPDPHVQKRALRWSGTEFFLEPFTPIDGEVQEPAIEKFVARSQH